MPRDAQGNAYLTCSECGGAVYHVDGEHHCDCDLEPEGYRIGDVGEVASEFRDVKGGGA
jgi:hypothetical protein